MQNSMNEVKKMQREVVKDGAHQLGKPPTKVVGAKGLWWSAFWPGLALACLIVPALSIFGGCAFIQAPEPEPAPTKVPDVPAHPDKYEAAPVADAATIKPLTDDNPADGEGKNYIPD